MSDAVAVTVRNLTAADGSCATRRPTGRCLSAVMMMTVLIMTLVLTAAASGSQVEPTAGAESTSAVSNTVTHPSAVATELVDGLNPIAMAEDAMGAIPGFEDGLSTAINIVILMTVLTLSPAVLVMCTCFTRIIIVLGLLRQAMGTHSMPPAQIITGISLFMTFLIMAPTAERVWHEAIQPYQAGDPAVASQMDVWNRARIPIRDFMFDQIDATDNWDSVYVLLEYRGYDVSDPSKLTLDDVDMLTLVPAFIMSELKVAFMIGFRIYLPFLVIDMIIASLLISMGMMMLPPVLISLPFKLLLFVLVDGWDLLISSLLMGFAQRTPAPDAEAMHIIEETGRFAVNVLSVAGWA